jgi:hypothetical protein
MTNEEIETAALRLDPRSRARLAGRLIESLETLSTEENAEIWIEEALRRDAELDADPSAARDASDVYRDARARLS